MRKGHLTKVASAAAAFGDRLPKTRLRRATWIGVLCLFIFGPLSAVGVLLFDYGDISVGEFVLYKAIFGIALGALVTPWIAMAAFGDDPPLEEAPPEAPPAVTSP
jgi:hypothetical protein